MEWLPSDSYFHALLLDPASPQTSASLLAYQVEGSDEEKIYSPINIGVQKLIFRYRVNSDEGFEFGVEFGVHSQFSIVDSGEAYMGGLQNTDFRIGGMLHYKRNKAVYRLTLFHQSSHLGDDFMLRTSYFLPNTKALNYEQLGIIRSSRLGYLRYYYGYGLNISPNTVRKRNEFQMGTLYQHPFAHNPDFAYLLGIDVKAYQQNDYRPNMKFGAGIELGRTWKNPFMIIAEYYRGHLPYSTLEFQKVNLYGLGVYFHI
ncbi:MAG: DUF1207 domain-containing protein [Candidatus Marinimicrobia bacterium]|nr:DUF1207 domain-containing protein [Candidatus Neomarinimicrobiota bacterium]